MAVARMSARMPFPRITTFLAQIFLVVATLFPYTARAATVPHVRVPLLPSEPAMHGVVDASWKDAVRLPLAFDFTNRRRTQRASAVYLAQDATGLDVAFVIHQRAPIVDATRSNGSGVYSDDNVAVQLNPQGSSGFGYSFAANARGVQSQSSSENTAYAPIWTSAATTSSTGYTVTMHIPFGAIRSGRSHAWRAQFARYSVARNNLIVWAYSPAASSATDPAYMGVISGIGQSAAAKHAARPAPRIQPYLLGVARSGINGGSTSQAGLDVALPITSTASFVGSFHPDYSNVEVDQQTISPTAFARQYQEVRPFFTQLGNSFEHHFGCLDCPTLLYTPAIPTFRQAYGLEGTQGPVGFGAFDAVGAQRTDAAQAANYYLETPGATYAATVERVQALTPAASDTTTEVNGGYQNQHSHLIGYGNFARESGTFVSDPNQSTYSEIGGGYAGPTASLVVARQFIGAQFAPLDGYTAQSDTGGYEAMGNQKYIFPTTSKLNDISLSGSVSRFWNHVGQPANFNANYQINVDFKDLLTLHVYQQSDFVRTYDGEFLPFAIGNGAFVGYNLSSNFPAGVVFSSGAYYHGEAISWSAFATEPLRKELSISFNANENIYGSHVASEPSFRDWQNSAALNWQFSRAASFSLGVRRINGINFPNSFQPPDFTPVFADNLSAAFHYLNGRNEFYLVYGDPNAFATAHAIFFKWILYAGAPKGT